MLPTNYYIYSEAIRKATLRLELSVILSHIEDDKYLTGQDKQELKHKLYNRMELTH